MEAVGVLDLDLVPLHTGKDVFAKSLRNLREPLLGEDVIKRRL